ncbi:hypothetical protein HCBAA847_1661 [Helicobacter cinaedi CCUG 18818 = ATCC BAA-847]|uniref:Uncharacterized protein n=1 Tax=Helicobacter cinaedi CCUG 18818 = ATCC BAA-847 TaxID=537971 RepID=A0AAI8QGQ0_9HELI|nr:hypothetical protein [Helicobacter cinaedi]EFR45511.1 hypothetical protein HCCG_00057 [Helicobacter cinaedi CCUG 18818 = ATCC BAA-847]BAM32891.1 hypothetical protein HCBAA847_1661 [Helicobacter cinaedi CCUG 18818 = ATCC BAA-847]
MEHFEIYSNAHIFEVCMNLERDKDFQEVFRKVIAEVSSAIKEKELAAKTAAFSVSSLVDEFQLACHGKGDPHTAQLCVNIAQETLERFANLEKEVA